MNQERTPWIRVFFLIVIISFGVFFGNAQAQSPDPFTEIKVQVDESGKITSPRKITVEIENRIGTGVKPTELKFIVTSKEFSNTSNLESVLVQLHEQLKHILTEYDFDLIIDKKSDIIQITNLNLLSTSSNTVNENFSNVKKTSSTVSNPDDSSDLSSSLFIPEWIRNTAVWWGEGRISDKEFLDAIQYLFDNNILKMSGHIEKDDFSSQMSYLQEEINRLKYELSQQKNIYNTIKKELDSYKSQEQQHRETATTANTYSDNIQTRTTQDSNYQQRQTSSGYSDVFSKAYLEQVAQTNPLIRGLLDGKIKFYVSPLPSYVDDSVREAVEHDMQFFDDMGSESIQFQRVYDENDADLWINWVKNYGTHGMEVGEAIFRAHVKIGLGADNCFGQWKPFDNVTIQRILWHELGHSLGFGHSEKEDNVMFWKTHTRFIDDYSDQLHLAEGYYKQIGFCNGGTMFYSVESEDDTNGFNLYVVPKGVKLQDFNDGTARYYPDCSRTDLMVKFAEYCNVGLGDSIVVYNPLDSVSDTASKINVTIIDYNESPAVDLGWDMGAMEYDFDAIEELLRYR